MSKTFSIGQLASLTNCKVPTIRYFEEIGLLPSAWRSEGNQRRYNESHRQRLDFIRHARALGFSQEEVRQLIDLQVSSQNSSQAHDIAQRHLDSVLEKIEQLKSLANELSHMVDCCDKGKDHECKVLDSLSNHESCGSKH